MIKRILVVDDQKGIRHLLNELFKRSGWEVYLSESGPEAIDKIKELGPIITVMDMIMPYMSGLEAAKKILADYPLTPIIIMTGDGDDKVKQQALAMGVRYCIVKPFDIMALLALVNEIYGEKSSKIS